MVNKGESAVFPKKGKNITTMLGIRLRIFATLKHVIFTVHIIGFLIFLILHNVDVLLLWFC